MKPRPVAYALGVLAMALLFAGIVKGVTGITLGTGGAISCGSALRPVTTKVDLCRPLVSTAQTGSIVLIAAGAVAVVGCLLAHRATKKTSAE